MENLTAYFQEKEMMGVLKVLNFSLLESILRPRITVLLHWGTYLNLIEPELHRLLLDSGHPLRVVIFRGEELGDSVYCGEKILGKVVPIRAENIYLEGTLLPPHLAAKGIVRAGWEPVPTRGCPRPLELP